MTPAGRVFILPPMTTAVAQQSVAFSGRQWTAANRGLILPFSGRFWTSRDINSARQLNICSMGPLISCGLGQTCIPICSHLQPFAEPEVSVQLLQQPPAKRMSHRGNSLRPQQIEAVSSVRLGSSRRTRLVDKHAVNNPSAHISTFFILSV